MRMTNVSGSSPTHLVEILAPTLESRSLFLAQPESQNLLWTSGQGHWQLVGVLKEPGCPFELIQGKEVLTGLICSTYQKSHVFVSFILESNRKQKVSEGFLNDSSQRTICGTQYIE